MYSRTKEDQNTAQLKYSKTHIPTGLALVHLGASRCTSRLATASRIARRPYRAADVLAVSDGRPGRTSLASFARLASSCRLPPSLPKSNTVAVASSVLQPTVRHRTQPIYRRRPRYPEASFVFTDVPVTAVVRRPGNADTMHSVSNLRSALCHSVPRGFTFAFSLIGISSVLLQLTYFY
jgi:hypothetical protein